MVAYEELQVAQQEAFDRALDKMLSYASMDLEERDPREAVRYGNFRKDFEGTKVERGEIDEEKLEQYLSRGILRRDDGELEINSVWLPSQVETLESHGMVDLDFGNLYIARDEELGIEKAIYGDENGYRSNADHGGSLKFTIDGDIENELRGERRSDQRIEEMLAEFVAESHDGIEDKKSYIENFSLEEFLNDKNTISRKPTKERQGGETKMTDYDSAEEIKEAAEEGEIEDFDSYNQIRQEYEENNEVSVTDRIAITEGFQEMLLRETNSKINHAQDVYEDGDDLAGDAETFAGYVSTLAEEAANTAEDYEDAIREIASRGESVLRRAGENLEEVNSTLDDAQDEFEQARQTLESGLESAREHKERFDERREDLDELEEYLGLNESDEEEDGGE